MKSKSNPGWFRAYLKCSHDSRAPVLFRGDELREDRELQLKSIVKCSKCLNVDTGMPSETVARGSNAQTSSNSLENTCTTPSNLPFTAIGIQNNAELMNIFNRVSEHANTSLNQMFHLCQAKNESKQYFKRKRHYFADLWKDTFLEATAEYSDDDENEEQEQEEEEQAEIPPMQDPPASVATARNVMSAQQFMALSGQAQKNLEAARNAKKRKQTD